MADNPYDDLDLGRTLRGLKAGQKVLGRYALVRILGRGGMGVVWLARDEHLEVEIALKLLPEMIASDRGAIDDMKRETRRSRELAHRSIVKVYQFEFQGEVAAISMEYVDGQTLADAKAEQPGRCFNHTQIEPWLAEICDALDYAHQDARMVHRDLKPANIMLNSRGRIKIADFGISSTIVDSVSQLSLRHGSSGTPPYMSPQQVNGEKPSPLDDIYSLGATLYDLLTGKPPFYRGNASTIAHQIANVVPPLLTARRAELEATADPIPKQWEDTIAACLAKDPAMRPQNAKEILERLRGTSGPAVPVAPSVAETLGPDTIGQRIGRKRKVLLIGTGVFVIAALVTWSLIRSRTAPAHETRAVSQTPPPAATPAPTASASTFTAAEKDYEKALEFGFGMNRRQIDLREALSWLIRAADQGLPEARGRLALDTDLGISGVLTKDPLRAAELAQQALADGLIVRAQSRATAQEVLATLYRRGVGLPKDLRKAVELYQKAADQGNSVAQNSLGYLYEKGTGVTKDLSKAVELYQKAADQGNAVAQTALGYRYENGTGVAKDLSKAVELYRKAADQGNAAGQNNLGICYENGTGVAKDLSKAVELYQKAADQGSAFAQNNLGICYENGTGVAKDLSKAVELYQKAADQGSADGQNNLGICYENGTGVAKDLSKAVELYRKAADQGYARAQAYLAWLYENGTGVAKDLSKAVELYRKAADQGYAFAQNNLGHFYENGTGVAKDLSKAVELYQKAADQGNADAQASLGICYENGTGVTKDLSKAVELYQKAADQGNARAQNNLGVCYEKGTGVAKDLRKAVELYQKAADQGNAVAQANLGYLYEKGTGVAKDLRKAVELYQKAADQGNARGQNNLGACYENGTGVVKDLKKAEQLYQKAADQGNTKARENLEAIRKLRR
jgi:TPR repeat protein/serine/threonine protein kinase